MWALSQGIRVYGAASMGALRAAELGPFGMEGVGWIFSAYQRGELTDDDEVAVAHAPAELQFEPVSVAMVNVRRTLVAATEAGVIDIGDRRRCETLAKQIFFADRTYDVLFDAMMQTDPACAARLKDWITTGSVDQKAIDARDMLHAMKADRAEFDPTVQGGFINTIFWDRLVHEFSSGHLSLEASLEAEIVLEELRLSPTDYAHAFESALLREFALSGPLFERYSPVEISNLDELRTRYGLAASRIEAIELLTLASSEQSAQRALAQMAPRAEKGLVNVTVASGQYQRLLRRGLDKQLRLQNDREPFSATEVRQALECHFRTIGLPPDESKHWARILGFASEADFGQALAREARYKRAIANEAG